MKTIRLLVSLAVLVPGLVFSAPARKPRITEQFVPNHYIVELTGDSVIAGVHKQAGGGKALRSLSAHQNHVATHRTRVGTEQAAARAVLEAKGAEFRHSVDLVLNAVVVKYTGSRTDLENVPGVKRVYPVRKMKRNLDHALKLFQVTDVWNQIGGSANAGAGVKIGLLDEGIDFSHPGFNDSGFTAPPGYPKYDSAADQKLTNNKVIVARSYANMISQAVDGTNDTDPTINDHSGHGTATAVAAAGSPNTGAFGTIAGAAPGAYLGIYRVWNTIDDTITDAAFLAALNDAVADGMDVVNISIGPLYADSTRLDQDVWGQAVEAAYQAGVVVVIAAGNSGPQFTTLGSPGGSPHAIAVGASSNDRAFGPAIWAPWIGVLGGPNTSVSGTVVVNSSDGPAPSSPVTGQLVDAASLNNAYGCSAFGKEVSGNIVIMSRGPSASPCSFAVKVGNAQTAGAIGAIVVDYQSNTDAGFDPPAMVISPASLPAQMLDFYSGDYLSSYLPILGSIQLTMGFTDTFAVTPNKLASFSSAGPSPDLLLKPDVVAVGQDLLLATQRIYSAGDMYDASGYTVADGTSFSAPFTAGIAAMIKAARPGLTTDQYRSLVINTAKGMVDARGNPHGTQQVGAGLANALNAYRSTATVSPVSLSLGVSATTSPSITSAITLSNVSKSSDTYSLSTDSVDGVLSPSFDTSTVQIGPGQSMTVNVQFKGSSLAPGAYQGAILATSSTSGTQLRIPYWLDIPSGPATIFDIYVDPYDVRNSLIYDAIEFRILDSAGAPITNVSPVVTIVSGSGKVNALNSADAPNANVNAGNGYIVQDVPGLWTVDVTLGTGNNVFRVTAGSLTKDFTIYGCRSIDVLGNCY